MTAPTDNGQVKRPRSGRGRVARVRAALQRNKIFFETAAALFLSVMALIVSAEQLSIGKEQVTIARQQSLPHFSVGYKQPQDEKTGEVTSDKICIFNNGGFMCDFACQCDVFFSVAPKGHGTHDKARRVPVTGYYMKVCPTGNAMGLVATVERGDHTADLLGPLVADLDKAGYVFYPYAYVCLTCSDMYGSSHTECWLVGDAAASTIGTSSFLLDSGSQDSRTWEQVDKSWRDGPLVLGLVGADEILGYSRGRDAGAAH